MKKNKKFELKVLEARPTDVGRGVVRIDPDEMERLKLIAGDVLEVKGQRTTVGICWPGLPDDRGRKVIRMDGIIRKNAGVSVDDMVAIKKVEGKNAKKITFAPTEPVKLMGGEEYLSQHLSGRALHKGDIIELNVMGRKVDLVVTKVKPSADAVLVTKGTGISISEKVAKQDIGIIPTVTYEDIGGLSDEVKKVREMIELPFRHPEIFERLGIEAPKGVLLRGPPGTGKTLLAKAVASETNANFISLSGPEVMSKFYGQSEENIREIFQKAQEDAPSIIFIDEIDSIAPKRDEVQGEVERRVVAQLLSLMDGLEARGKVIVIGATNRPNSIDPALRRPGRFDREIEIGIPDRNGRLEILQIHTRGMPLGTTVKLPEVASITHGYAGADLEALCKEAGMRALRRVLPDLNIEEDTIPAEALNKLRVTKTDILEAFREFEPATLREVIVESPDVKWEDIGGLESAKQELVEVAEWPLRYPNLFGRMNTELPRGILLEGPPGTGKTLLAKAVASESEANFISVKGPEFLSKWVGESEKSVREVFRKARQATPCIVFFDELDAVAPVRSGASCDSHVSERIISQLLTELDGLDSLHGVLVLAATNRKDIIDPALLRPGRFDRHVNVGMPDVDAREEIFRIHTRGKPTSMDVDPCIMARATEGWSGAEIASACQEAGMLAIRDYVKSGGKDDPQAVKKCRIKLDHFQRALERIKGVDLQKYISKEVNECQKNKTSQENKKTEMMVA